MKLDDEHTKLLKELKAPRFVTKLSEEKFNKLRAWITELLIVHRHSEDDEVAALLYDDDECRL